MADKVSDGSYVYRPIESAGDIALCRNALARGNYPLGMTDCEVVGINGDCSCNCPAAEYSSRTCERSLEEDAEAAPYLVAKESPDA